MKPLLGILYAFLTFTQLPKAKSQAQDNALTCVTDYWLTIDCFLKFTAITNRSDNTSYWLEFYLKNPDGVYNCSLTLGKDGYNCTFKALNMLYQSSFLSYNYFVVSLCYLENGLIKSELDSKYYPSKHIKPLTPTNLTVSKADGKYIFQWTSGYERHEYYQALPFQYKLLYLKEGYPDSELTVHVVGTQFNISEAKLERGTQYIAMVCNEIQHLDVYNGTSSHWSTPVKWITTQAQDNALTCVTDYWLTIDCFLKFTAITNRSDNTSYWLEFDLKNPDGVYNCSLTLGKDGYNCTFKALNMLYQSSFVSYNYFVVSLCYLENGLIKSELDSKYYPSKHIKPLTPTNLTVSKADGKYIFQWTSGYEQHEYYQALPFQYKLLYLKEGYPDSELTVHVVGTQFNISEAKLERGTQYIAMVCNEIQHLDVYNGTSSHWSTPVKWITTQASAVPSFAEHNPAVLSSTTMMAFLTCLSITFLVFCPAARKKIKEIIWVAAPSPNFQSFFQNHQGHFKDWVPKDQVQQVYNEEFSTIDEIAEITAVQQDQGNICSMHFTPQYQTPYVCPSAEVWAPLQISDTRSAASISCKDLDFLPEESAVEQPMLCLTMFEPIALEGFLCMEDLELSQEGMEPAETLTITPKPAQNFFTQNYCTLTNTTFGLIPTFTTEPCNPEPVPAGHASKEPLNEQTEENTSELVALTLDCLQLSMDD